MAYRESAHAETAMRDVGAVRGTPGSFLAYCMERITWMGNSLDYRRLGNILRGELTDIQHRVPAQREKGRNMVCSRPLGFRGHLVSRL